MSRFRMSDDAVVDTKNASNHWDEDTRWDGRNHISCATGDQWQHETLYRSRKGRYYTVHSSNWDGSSDSAEWVSNEEAVRWLLDCAHLEVDSPDFPEELKPLVDSIVE